MNTAKLNIFLDITGIQFNLHNLFFFTVFENSIEYKREFEFGMIQKREKNGELFKGIRIC